MKTCSGIRYRASATRKCHFGCQEGRFQFDFSSICTLHPRVGVVGAPYRATSYQAPLSPCRSWSESSGSPETRFLCSFLALCQLLAEGTRGDPYTLCEISALSVRSTLPKHPHGSLQVPSTLRRVRQPVEQPPRPDFRMKSPCLGGLSARCDYRFYALVIAGSKSEEHPSKTSTWVIGSA